MIYSVIQINILSSLWMVVMFGVQFFSSFFPPVWKVNILWLWIARIMYVRKIVPGNKGQFHFVQLLLRQLVSFILHDAFRGSSPHIPLIPLICQPFIAKWCVNKGKTFFLSLHPNCQSNMFAVINAKLR